MRYSLVIYNSSTVKEISGYSKTKKFAKLNESSLKDIVTFTNNFYNEDDLIEYLCDYDLLPTIGQDKKIGIAYYKSKNNIPKILQYGVSYSRDAKFFDYNNLTNFFHKHLTDDDFMEEFFNKYYEKLVNVPYFRNCLQQLLNTYNVYANCGNIPLEAYSFMSEFILLYTIKKDKNGCTVRDFTRLRDLAMFVVNYIREKNMRVKPIIAKSETIESVQNLITHYEQLLRNGDFQEEAKEAYEAAIKRLEHTLESLEFPIRSRRREDEFTEN